MSSAICFHLRAPGTWLAVIGFVVIGAAGLALPQWQFLVSVALSKGIVALGLALSMIVSAVLAFVLGFLLARYRDIFFAMLTLALSMIGYGLLLNNVELGGSDGFNVNAPTLGSSATPWQLTGTNLFAVGFIAAIVCVMVVALYMRSTPGRLGPAIKDNEIRVEYLGTSARQNIHLTYIIAGALAGLGGALQAFNIGHIDPDMAFWTTSGEFVFIAVLSGTRFAFSPFIGALLLEVARAMAYRYAPNTWQIVMGAIMLAIIAFLPGGLTSLGLGRRKTAAAHPVTQTKTARASGDATA